MDSIFKICKNGACGITISGLEKDNDEYLNEDSEIIVSTRNYAYSQTVTLNAITSIKSDGEETLQEYTIVKHEMDCIDESDAQLPIDGLYQITHIIIPNKKWLDYVIERDKGALDAYNLIYYYDEGLQSFIKYINEESIPVSVEEVLQVNALPPTDVGEKTCTIIRGDKNTFCMCYLNECFYKICKNLLSNLPGRCQNKLDDFKLSIYNRDIIWMSINVIKYLIDLAQYYEAQRILENITQCGSICNNIDTTSVKGGGCGCNN